MLLYHIRHSPSILHRIDQITVMSTSGKFPEEIRGASYQFDNFPRLARLATKERGFSAEDIVLAMVDDVASARGIGFVSSDFAAPLTKQITSLLDRLSLSEQRRFVERYGATLVGSTRRAGGDYSSALKELFSLGKLVVTKGRFTNLIENDNNQVSAACEREIGKQEILPGSFHLMLNCTGFSSIKQSSMPLMRNILSGELPGSSVHC